MYDSGLFIIFSACEVTGTSSQSYNSTYYVTESYTEYYFGSCGFFGWSRCGHSRVRYVSYCVMCECELIKLYAHTVNADVRLSYFICQNGSVH